MFSSKDYHEREINASLAKSYTLEKKKYESTSLTPPIKQKRRRTKYHTKTSRFKQPSTLHGDKTKNKTKNKTKTKELHDHAELRSKKKALAPTRLAAKSARTPPCS